jgi:hypothetical protein
MLGGELSCGLFNLPSRHTEAAFGRFFVSTCGPVHIALPN